MLISIFLRICYWVL